MHIYSVCNNYIEAYLPINTACPLVKTFVIGRKFAQIGTFWWGFHYSVRIIACLTKCCATVVRTWRDGK